MMQGNFDVWKDDLVRIQDIMLVHIIPDAWLLTVDYCSRQSDLHENRVTNPLVNFLKKIKARKRHLFEHVHFKIFPQVGVNPAEDQPGIIDIFLSPNSSDDEEVYLSYECKWLKNTNDSFSKYVGEEGVGRYICGKYSSGVPYGNMIGYVLGGDLLCSSHGIAKRLKNVHLKSILDYKPHTSYFRVLHSIHARDNATIPIEITHILLPYC